MVELKGKKLLGTVILSLLVMGALGYGNLPQAYCPLENTTHRYIHMSESRKTITKVLPSEDEEGWSILDDRCQSGLQIGEWIPINLELLDQCPECPWCPVECPPCKCPECAEPECPECSEEPNYYCESKDSKRYCFELRDYEDKEDYRCLYDENNLRRYYACEEGWKEIAGVCPPCIQTCKGCGGGGSCDPCICSPCIACDEVNVLAYIPNDDCSIKLKYFCDGIGTVKADGTPVNCIEDGTLAMPFG